MAICSYQISVSYCISWKGRTQTKDLIGQSFAYWEKILMARCSIPCRKEFFFLSHNVQTDSGADTSFCSLSTRDETTGSEADHSLLCSAKYNNWRNYVSARLFALMIYTGTISPLPLPENCMLQILAFITELILIRQVFKSRVFCIRKAATFYSAKLGKRNLCNEVPKRISPIISDFQQVFWVS